jgi:hypothetical protein
VYRTYARSVAAVTGCLFLCACQNLPLLAQKPVTLVPGITVTAPALDLTPTVLVEVMQQPQIAPPAALPPPTATSQDTEAASAPLNAALVQ